MLIFFQDLPGQSQHANHEGAKRAPHRCIPGLKGSGVATRGGASRSSLEPLPTIRYITFNIFFSC